MGLGLHAIFLAANPNTFRYTYAMVKEVSVVFRTPLTVIKFGSGS